MANYNLTQNEKLHEDTHTHNLTKNRKIYNRFRAWIKPWSNNYWHAAV